MSKLSEGQEKAKKNVASEVAAAKKRVADNQKKQPAKKAAKKAAPDKKSVSRFVFGEVLAQHEVVSELNKVISEAEKIVEGMEDHHEFENAQLILNEIYHTGKQIDKRNDNTPEHDMANLKKAVAHLEQIKNLNK